MSIFISTALLRHGGARPSPVAQWRTARQQQQSPPHPHPRRAAVAVAAASRVWRPSLDDVDRISSGDAAKVRGTGSRLIPHRLNAEERQLYDAAKKRGYLSVRGTGYRKERKGYPLPNIYRQWCDAKAQVAVVLEQVRRRQGRGRAHALATAQVGRGRGRTGRASRRPVGRADISEGFQMTEMHDQLIRRRP